MYYRMAECRYGGTWVSENAKKEIPEAFWLLPMKSTRKKT
jgi:hypothetical protein